MILLTKRVRTEDIAVRKVKSCGILCFQKRPTLAFLLMRHPHRYDLPKGHIREGESELECAIREFTEETGISEKEIILESQFQYQEIYYPRYKRFQGEKVEKTLVIFLAWMKEKTTVSPSEHKSYEWINWNPPHKIQKRTIDPLLKKIESYFQNEENLVL